VGRRVCPSQKKKHTFLRGLVKSFPGFYRLFIDLIEGTLVFFFFRFGRLKLLNCVFNFIILQVFIIFIVIFLSDFSS
jgi:hypothetical protein